jgi:3-dehydroquinate dehydratase-2
MLGLREPDIYGAQTYDDLVAFVQQSANELGMQADVRQSNHEGELVTWIQQARGTADAIIINPAAYTHTTVEVHLSDVHAREEFRRVSYCAMACQTVIAGQGFASYRAAMQFLVAA